MLDIKFLRENPEIVKQNIKNKFQDKKLPLVDEVIQFDKERRETQQKADDWRAYGAGEKRRSRGDESRSGKKCGRTGCFGEAGVRTCR